MIDGLWSALVPHVGSLASLLLIGNLVFVGWLARKIDRIDRKLPIQDGELKAVAKDLASFGHRLDQIDSKLEDVGHLRERIAVLEDRSNGSRKTR